MKWVFICRFSCLQRLGHGWVPHLLVPEPRYCPDPPLPGLVCVTKRIRREWQGVTCARRAWTCTGLQHVLSRFPSPLLPLPVYSPSLPHSGGSQVMSNPTETKQRGKGTATSWQWAHTQMTYRLTSQPRVISKDGRAQANILTTTHEGPWTRTIALICAWIPDSQNQRHVINV